MQRTQIKHVSLADPISVPAKYESVLRDMAHIFSCAPFDHTLKTTFEVPAELAILLSQILLRLSKAGTYSIVHMERKLSTFETAAILGVSRPFLIKSILDKGLLPYETVGRRGDRRVKIEDLLKFERTRAVLRSQALDELAQMNAEFIITGIDSDEQE